MDVEYRELLAGADIDTDRFIVTPVDGSVSCAEEVTGAYLLASTFNFSLGRSEVENPGAGFATFEGFCDCSVFVSTYNELHVVEEERGCYIV